jgi:hypothetical protein
VVVLLVKVCAIGLPVPAEEPVIPALAAAVQLNVLPTTLLLIATLLVWPEQMLSAEAVAFGVGFTVIIISNGTPGQEPEPVGVTV